MNILTNNIKQLYFKYFSAAFGSTMISSIYGLVDMAIVGQYLGPMGTASLAVVAPIWNIIYSLGLLTGIGGSVLFSIARGENNKEKEKEYFSSAFIATILISLICWLTIIFFDKQLLTLFGADESLLPLARAYLTPVKFGVPLFIFNQLLAAFLRNDNNPTLATVAVLTGGIFNMFADYIFVFIFELGIFGAGLATTLGALLTFMILITHFLSKKNTLSFVFPRKSLSLFKIIIITGFSTFFIDIAMGILTMFFNRQIMTYIGTDALAIYGVIVNISTIVQCCAYSVGQASQPIISTNFGAKLNTRVIETLKYSLYTVAAFGIVWTILICLFPITFIKIFMTPTDGVLEIAPMILRLYGISFLLLPLNIFSTYYFQSIMKPKVSFMISVLRGLVISCSLIFILPLLFGSTALWLTMPITELIVVCIVIYYMSIYTKKMKETDSV